MIRPWRKVGERVDYDCGFFKIRVRRSASPETGKEHPFYILSTQPWINVVALTKEGRLLLVSQFRHGSEDVGLEIPGGAMDGSDASPLEAAKRELLEETGHRSDDWLELGVIQPNPAILDNTCTIFLARDAVEAAPLKLDEAEELEVTQCDPLEVPRMVREGKIRHALVLAALHLYEIHLAEGR